MAKHFSLVMVWLLLSTSPAWAENWAHWRGPMSTGATNGAPPTEFSSTQNVKWKAAITRASSGSPIVWENRVFVLLRYPMRRVLAAFHSKCNVTIALAASSCGNKLLSKPSRISPRTTPTLMPLPHPAPMASMCTLTSVRAACSVIQSMVS